MIARVSSGWAWMRAAMCSVSSAGFADEMVADRFDKCDVFHNGIRWKSLTYRQFRCFGF